MRKVIGALAAAMLIWVGFGTPVGAKEEMCVPMGEITLKSPNPEPKRAPVLFPHAVHFNYTCRECHHKWEKETPIKGCTAAGCHDLAELPKGSGGRPLPETTQIRYFKYAYHQMCIGCHLQISKNNEALQATRLPGAQKMAPGGPTGCIQCHPKK